MLPKTRSVRAVVVTAFVLGATLPLLAAMAADPQRDAMASPAPQSTSVPPSGTPQQAAAPAGAPASAATTPTATEAAETDTSHNQDGIVAIVNDHPISEYDLRQRMALVMSTSNIPQTPEMRKKIHDQVLEKLEEELIQRQEALKNDITVSSVEVDKQIAAIVHDNNMTVDQLKAVLAHGHVELSTLRAQIAASNSLAEDRGTGICGPREHHAGTSRRRNGAHLRGSEQSPLCRVGNLPGGRQPRPRRKSAQGRAKP